VLAWLTKKYVEDRFRAPEWGTPLRKPFLLGAAGMAVVIVLAGLQLYEVDRREASSAAAVARAIAERGPCFGAAALDDPDACEPVPYDRLVPAPVDAANDKSMAYPSVSGGKDCFSYLPNFRQVRCTFGDEDADVEVALVGNSHAGQWLTALDRLAQKNGWKITTYLASQCAAADVAQAFDSADYTDACERWVDRATRAVERSQPDLVIYTNRISVGAEGRTYEESIPLYADGMETVLGRWQEAALKVLVLHDTPAPGSSIPDCLAANPDDLSACDGKREDWIAPEPAEDAVREVGDPLIRFVDLNDHVCGPEICTAVTGGVVTYFDGSHLTATFNSTLDRYLGPPVRDLLAAGR
jgi:hypothetical protein